MSSSARLALAVVLGVLLILGTTVTFAALALHRDDSVRVDVHETEGGRIALRIPVSLVKAAVAFTPPSLRREIVSELDGVNPQLPALRAACGELERCADGVLLEVAEGGDRIQVAKAGGALQVRVRSGGDSIRISIPLGAVRFTLDALGELGDES